jgi:hypothetical protein
MRSIYLLLSTSRSTPSTSRSTPEYFTKYPRVLRKVPPSTSQSTPEYFAKYPRVLHKVPLSTSQGTTEYFAKYPEYFAKYPRVPRKVPPSTSQGTPSTSQGTHEYFATKCPPSTSRPCRPKTASETPHPPRIPAAHCGRPSCRGRCGATFRMGRRSGRRCRCPGTARGDSRPACCR